jgi:Ankyrin repeats (3 copies)
MTMNDTDYMESILECMKLALSKDNQIREILFNKFKEDNRNPIFLAYLLMECHENLNSLKWLHQQGVKLSEQSEQGLTVLHEVARSDIAQKRPIRAWNTVQWLCDNGAKINAEDQDKRTPLFYALSKFDFNMVSLLLQKQATVHKRSLCHLTLGINQYVLCRSEEDPFCQYGEKLILESLYENPGFIYNYAADEFIHTRQEFVDYLKRHVNPGSREILDRLEDRIALCEFYEKTLAISLVTGEPICQNELDDAMASIVKRHDDLFVNDLLKAFEGTHPVVKTPAARTAFTEFGLKSIKDSFRDDPASALSLLVRFLQYLNAGDILYFLRCIDIDNVLVATPKTICQLAINLDDRSNELSRICEESGEDDIGMKKVLNTIKWFSLTYLLLAKEGSDQSGFHAWRLILEFFPMHEFGLVNFESFDDLPDQGKSMICRYISQLFIKDRENKSLTSKLVSLFGPSALANANTPPAHQMFITRIKRELEEPTQDSKAHKVSKDEENIDSKKPGI